MKRFKNILVVVNDDSELKHNPAVLRGIALAQQNHARLTLMDVVSPPDGAITEYKGIISAEELTENIISDRMKRLEKINELTESNFDVHIKVSIGRDFIEIVRQVVLEKHDLLLKVANDQPISFDSSDFHLMRKCPQPVWLFKRQEQNTSPKILAAIDLSLESYDEGKALNAFIMDLATSLAKWENRELHVLSCWSLYGENAMRHSGFLKVSNEKFEELLKEEEQANRTRMNALIAQYPNQKIETHLIKGKPVDIIPAFSQDNDIEVMVMGTVARSGIPGLLIGNTAETILRLINSSVITLKPKGFESPVK